MNQNFLAFVRENPRGICRIAGFWTNEADEACCDNALTIRNRFGKSINTKSILVTEGTIKANIINKFLPEYFVIANSGIGCAQNLIISSSRGKSIMIAFDSDYHQNPSVIKQLARFLHLRFADNRTNNS